MYGTEGEGTRSPSVPEGEGTRSLSVPEGEGTRSLSVRDQRVRGRGH